tara:strand:+ start:17365 stop:18417 length:1053 start_codon:yes stop_codon:yes gene_type:complete
LEIQTLKIVLASYNTVNIKHGGPRTQMLQTKTNLEALGHEVKLYETWDDSFNNNDADLYHLFASNFAVYDLARHLNSTGKIFVTSPIFFTRRSEHTIRWTIRADNIMRKFISGIWSDYGFTKDICEWSSAILPNTSSEKMLLANGMNIPSKKLFLIPNGVEERFKSGNAKYFYDKYGIKDFILNVGHVGVERKNTLSLIRALSTIDHPAVIIGKISNTQEGKQCVYEAKKNKNLLLINGIDHDSELLSSAYAAAKVFALPARYETPGIAALEAGLAGSQIVITPFGGTKDYFEEMAHYVNPYSVDDIRNGIKIALHTPKNNKLSTHIQNKFLWKHIAKSTAEVYNAVCKK